MLKFFIGTDGGAAKSAASALAKGTEVVRFGEGGEPFSNVLGFLEQRGMFATKLTLILDHPLDDTDGEGLVEGHVKDFSDADADVIIIEDSLPAALKKKIPTNAEIKSFDLPLAPEPEPPPSVFALTDAFTAGDRKRAWVTYRTLVESGVEPEEVHGALAWSVRGMVLAAKTKSAVEAGMKDYPYRKAKSAVQKIGLPKAEALSAELVALYHNSRMGRGDLEDLVEIFLLKK